MTVSFAFQSFYGFCQKIDSLESLLVKSGGIERANILYQLAFEYVDVDYEAAQTYASQAYTLATRHADSMLIVKAGRIGALPLARLDKGDSSLALSLSILPIARRNNYVDELKHILNRLGSAYSYIGKHDSALIYHFESLSLRECVGDEFDISISLTNIGFVYYNLDDFEKAISFYQRALGYKKRSKNSYGLDQLLLNMSVCYAYQGEFNKASQFADDAYNLCKGSCTEYFLMMVNFNFGKIAHGRKDFQRAKRKFYESYELAKVTNNARMKIDNIVCLLEIARIINDQKLERDLLIEAEALTSDVAGYPLSTINLYNQLLQTYRVRGEYQKTALYQYKYIQLKDSIDDDNITKNLMRVESDYMERENRAKIEAQEKVLRLNNDVMSRQRTLNVIAGFVAILSIAFVFVLIQNIKQKRRVNTLLEQRVKERTIELVENHKLLLKAIRERDIQVERMSNEIRSSLATIKGLGLIVSHDGSSENASNYLAN